MKETHPNRWTRGRVAFINANEQLWPEMRSLTMIHLVCCCMHISIDFFVFGPFAMPQCERHCFIRLPQNAYKLLSVMLVIILNLCMHSLMNECICACFDCYLPALATVGVIFQTSSPTIWHSPVKYDRDAQRRRRRPRLIQLLYFNELTNQGWLFTFLWFSWIKMQRHTVYKIKFEPFWLDLNLKLGEKSKLITKKNKNKEIFFWNYHFSKVFLITLDRWTHKFNREHWNNWCCNTSVDNWTSLYYRRQKNKTFANKPFCYCQNTTGMVIVYICQIAIEIKDKIDLFGNR